MHIVSHHLGWDEGLVFLGWWLRSLSETIWYVETQRPKWKGELP